MSDQPSLQADFTFASAEPFPLDAGGSLQPASLRYTVYGELNRQGDNAILVCHALSGSSQVADWWEGMFGPDRPFDLGKYCIIGINVLGSCYGSTGPRSLNPGTGQPYAGDFPLVSIGDMVRAQALLLDHLGIERLHTVIGGSIGGLQTLAWASMYPERVARCIAIGAAPLNAMGLALSHLQRQAICNDPAWKNGFYSPDAQPWAGLALARGIAMCSYKSAQLFDDRFGRAPNRGTEEPTAKLSDRYDIAGYLDYQGSSFVKRFDANSYLLLSKAMDNFDFGDQASEEAALRQITARVLMIGISSDWLFPAADVQALASRMQAAGVDAEYAEMESDHGHDAFLANVDLLAPLVTPFLRKGKQTAPVSFPLGT